MKLLRVAFLFFLLTVALVHAQWDKDDYEIFELQSALEKDEGEGATFYSFFNLTRGATATEIRKAYRARSMELHPDKHQSSEDSRRRFERLGVINKILRDHRRDRYNHFLTNGFPKWRGSGYFYARYRPGLGSVLAFLVLVTASIELLIRRLNYNRDQQRLRSLIETAKVLAWGARFRSIEAGLRASENGEADSLNKGVIVPAEKKVRVPLSGIQVPALAAKKDGQDERAYWDEDEKAVRKAITSNVTTNDPLSTGSKRQVDALVTREAEVFILDPFSKEWTLLDETATAKPSIQSTWPFSLTKAIVGKVTGAQGAKTGEDGDEQEGDLAAVASAAKASSSGKKNKKKKQQ